MANKQEEDKLQLFQGRLDDVFANLSVQVVTELLDKAGIEQEFDLIKWLYLLEEEFFTPSGQSEHDAAKDLAGKVLDFRMTGQGKGEGTEKGKYISLRKYSTREIIIAERSVIIASLNASKHQDKHVTIPEIGWKIDEERFGQLKQQPPSNPPVYVKKETFAEHVKRFGSFVVYRHRAASVNLGYIEGKVSVKMHRNRLGDCDVSSVGTYKQLLASFEDKFETPSKMAACIRYFLTSRNLAPGTSAKKLAEYMGCTVEDLEDEFKDGFFGFLHLFFIKECVGFTSPHSSAKNARYPFFLIQAMTLNLWEQYNIDLENVFGGNDSYAGVLTRTGVMDSDTGDVKNSVKKGAERVINTWFQSLIAVSIVMSPSKRSYLEAFMSGNAPSATGLICIRELMANLLETTYGAKPQQ